jgi:hypothetical protein
MKLLIDECLSPELARLARDRGHGESSHVVWLKRGGWEDWSLASFIVDGDWTFVTRTRSISEAPLPSAGRKGNIHASPFMPD